MKKIVLLFSLSLLFAVTSNACIKDHPITIDKTGSDISRCCFFSSDPDLYLNDNSKIWTQKIATPSSYTTTSTKNIAINLSDDETENIIKVLEGGWTSSFPMTPGNRHDSTFKRVTNSKSITK